MRDGVIGINPAGSGSDPSAALRLGEQEVLPKPNSTLHRALVGIALEVQGTDYSEVEHTAVLAKVEKAC